MPPSVIDKCLSERRVHAGELQRLKTKSVSVTLTIPSVDFLLNKLDGLITDAKDNHRKIAAVCDPADLPIHETELFVLLDGIDELSCQLIEQKASLNKSIPHTRASSSATSGTPHADIKLPKIDLPKFSGKLCEWLSFRDLFTSSVHNNSSLSDAQKLNYLQSSVTGEASNIIKAMFVTDANYSIAWNLLSNRYQNEREIAFSVIGKLLSLPNMHADSSSSLRLLVDSISECKRQLETLGLPVDKWDAILGAIVIQKLDKASIQAYELSLTTTAIPAFNDMLQHLEHRARALASGVHRMPSASKQPHAASGKIRVHHTNTKQPRCKICNGMHQHHKCPKFLEMPPAERHVQIKKINVCFNCLQDNHSSMNCTSKFTCRHCNKRHHSLIHLDRQESSSSEPHDQMLMHHANIQPHAAKKTTILPTALIKVLDKNGESQLCRAFLDWGATNSLITLSCVRKLGLKYNRTLTEQLTGLDSTPLGHAEGNLEFIMRPRFNGRHDPSYNVQAHVVKNITNFLPSSPCDNSKHQHLQKLQLADPGYFTPSKVDILLGSDIIFDLLSKGKIDGPEGTPSAVNSTLGWLVGGLSQAAETSLQFHHFQIDNKPHAVHQTSHQQRWKNTAAWRSNSHYWSS